MFVLLFFQAKTSIVFLIRSLCFSCHDFNTKTKNKLLFVFDRIRIIPNQRFLKKETPPPTHTVKERHGTPAQKKLPGTPWFDLRRPGRPEVRRAAETHQGPDGELGGAPGQDPEGILRRDPRDPD